MTQTTALDEDAVPKRVAEYRLERMEGEFVLYRVWRTRAVQLNHTAALVWQQCDAGRSVREITEAMCATYPEQAEAVRVDVARVLARLAAEGAIVRA